MRGHSPCLRGPVALSALGKHPILLAMENFSTPRRPLVPWVANVATLAVMVAATWWSSDQRPTNVVQSAAPVSPSPVPRLQARQPATGTAPGVNAATYVGTAQTLWPAQTTSLQGDSLKPVGFGAKVLR